MCQCSWRTRDSGSRLAGVPIIVAEGVGFDAEPQAELPQFLLELTDQLWCHTRYAEAHRKGRHAVAGDTAPGSARNGSWEMLLISGSAVHSWQIKSDKKERRNPRPTARSGASGCAAGEKTSIK